MSDFDAGDPPREPDGYWLKRGPAEGETLPRNRRLRGANQDEVLSYPFPWMALVVAVLWTLITVASPEPWDPPDAWQYIFCSLTVLWFSMDLHRWWRRTHRPTWKQLTRQMHFIEEEVRRVQQQAAEADRAKYGEPDDADEKL